MKITKFGHSCLLVEENGVRVLIDPGDYSTLPDSLGKLDAVVVTHEHPDHCSIPDLKKILLENKDLLIITNSSNSKKLELENIKTMVINAGQSTKVKDVVVEGAGEWHAYNHSCMESVENIGYFVGKLFYPGDAFTIPNRPVEILAYPAVGPWLKISESLEYLKAVKPRFAFPVHDAFLKISGGYYAHPERHSKEWGIKWIVLENDKPAEF